MWQILIILATPVLACPTITTREICADLCYSGLGGSPCGIMCNSNLDLSLMAYTLPTNTSEEVVGPRRTVCEILCKNNLGHPLCSCPTVFVGDVDWVGVCNAFCQLEGYTLYGCPLCNSRPTSRNNSQRPLMSLRTRSGKSLNWDALCVFLCNKGDGGSACNCDVIP